MDIVTEQNTIIYYQPDILSNAMCIDAGDFDYSDGSLSWLLNYKIDELPPIPAENSYNDENVNIFPETLTLEFTDLAGHDFDLGNTEIIFADECEITTEEVCQPPEPSKPPYTYTELIERALNDKGELTVSGIYQWISEHFPFYKEGDDRWKNSVRHNLSINPHFRKGNKALHGAGHLWTIAGKDAKKSWQIVSRHSPSYFLEV